MTAIHPISVGSERFDIALSFVTRRDIRLARALRDLLQPEFSVFLYADHQQLLSGAHGVTAYSKVFRCDARLTVILLRAGWGQTPRTAIEEVAIRDRALQTGLRSFMIVSMEEGVPLPAWAQSDTVCHPGWLDKPERTAKAIRDVARTARPTVAL
jgi:hypothetical protein